MGLGRIIEPETVAIAGTTPVIAFVDRDIARSLSAQIAENHRLAFARSFAYAVMLACWRARSLPSLSPPDNVKLIPLSIDAAAAAARLGAAIAGGEPRLAAYIAGTVYITALLET